MSQAHNSNRQTSARAKRKTDTAGVLEIKGKRGPKGNLDPSKPEAVGNAELNGSPDSTGNADFSKSEAPGNAEFNSSPDPTGNLDVSESVAAGNAELNSSPDPTGNLDVSKPKAAGNAELNSKPDSTGNTGSRSRKVKSASGGKKAETPQPVPVITSPAVMVPPCAMGDRLSVYVPIASSPAVPQPAAREEARLQAHNFLAEVQFLQDKPRVLITPQAYKEICLYVEIGRLEVGWLGTVSRTESGDFLIDKTYLIEQEVTGVETELTKHGQVKLLMELSSKGEEGVQQVERLRFWGHSHVRFATDPSGTDERTMMQFVHIDWFVRGIFNKYGSAKFDIYLNRLGVRIWDADWAIWDPVSGKILPPPASLPEVANCKPGARSLQVNTPTDAYQQLIPGQQLREQIQAEFQSKVTERVPSWLQPVRSAGTDTFGATMANAVSKDSPNDPLVPVRCDDSSRWGSKAVSKRSLNDPASDSKPTAPTHRRQKPRVSPDRSDTPVKKSKEEKNRD